MRGVAILRRACLSLALSLSAGGNGFAADDGDRVGWFERLRSPAARAAERLAAGDAEAALRLAPDPEWEGLAHLQRGDADAALRAFDAELATTADPAVRRRLDYNRALAAIRAQRFAEAIDGFDRVLETDADDLDARRNRDIAAQLMALQDAAQGDANGAGEEGSPAGEGDQSGDGERPDGEQGEGQDGAQGEPEGAGSDPGRDAADARDDASGQPGERSVSAGQRTADADGAGGAADPENGASEASEARAALAAEAAGDDDDDAGDAADTGTAALDDAVPEGTPLSESEQAIEQWLRRIPDDPAGLLRRKLEQTHRAEYPDVREGPRAW